MIESLRIPLGLRVSPTKLIERAAVGSRIGPGVRFEGTLFTGAGCSVQGHLQGAVVQLPGHSCGVIVHENATVEAFTNADSVEIHGRFEGRIDNPQGKVVLATTGELLGEVCAGELIVAAGVIDATIGVFPGGQ